MKEAKIKAAEEDVTLLIYTFHSKKKLVCMVLVLDAKTSRATIGHIYTQSFQSRPLSLFTTTQ